MSGFGPPPAANAPAGAAPGFGAAAAPPAAGGFGAAPAAPAAPAGFGAAPAAAAPAPAAAPAAGGFGAAAPAAAPAAPAAGGFGAAPAATPAAGGFGAAPAAAAAAPAAGGFGAAPAPATGGFGAPAAPAAAKAPADAAAAPAPPPAPPVAAAVPPFPLSPGTLETAIADGCLPDSVAKAVKAHLAAPVVTSVAATLPAGVVMPTAEPAVQALERGLWRRNQIGLSALLVLLSPRDPTRVDGFAAAVHGIMPQLVPHLLSVIHGRASTAAPPPAAAGGGGFGAAAPAAAAASGGAWATSTCGEQERCRQMAAEVLFLLTLHYPCPADAIAPLLTSLDQLITLHADGGVATSRAGLSSGGLVGGRGGMNGDRTADRGSYALPIGTAAATVTIVLGRVVCNALSVRRRKRDATGQLIRNPLVQTAAQTASAAVWKWLDASATTAATLEAAVAAIGGSRNSVRSAYGSALALVVGAGVGGSRGGSSSANDGVAPAEFIARDVHSIVSYAAAVYEHAVAAMTGSPQMEKAQNLVLVAIASSDALPLSKTCASPATADMLAASAVAAAVPAAPAVAGSDNAATLRGRSAWKGAALQQQSATDLLCVPRYALLIPIFDLIAYTLSKLLPVVKAAADADVAICAESARTVANLARRVEEVDALHTAVLAGDTATGAGAAPTAASAAANANASATWLPRFASGTAGANGAAANPAAQLAQATTAMQVAGDAANGARPAHSVIELMLVLSVLEEELPSDAGVDVFEDDEVKPAPELVERYGPASHLLFMVWCNLPRFASHFAATVDAAPMPSALARDLGITGRSGAGVAALASSSTAGFGSAAGGLFARLTGGAQATSQPTTVGGVPVMDAWSAEAYRVVTQLLDLYAAMAGASPERAKTVLVGMAADMLWHDLEWPALTRRALACLGLSVPGATAASFAVYDTATPMARPQRGGLTAPAFAAPPLPHWATGAAMQKERLQFVAAVMRLVTRVLERLPTASVDVTPLLRLVPAEALLNVLSTQRLPATTVGAIFGALGAIMLRHPNGSALAATALQECARWGLVPTAVRGAAGGSGALAASGFGVVGAQQPQQAAVSGDSLSSIFTMETRSGRFPFTYGFIRFALACAALAPKSPILPGIVRFVSHDVLPQLPTRACRNPQVGRYGLGAAAIALLEVCARERGLHHEVAPALAAPSSAAGATNGGAAPSSSGAAAVDVRISVDDLLALSRAPVDVASVLALLVRTNGTDAIGAVPVTAMHTTCLRQTLRLLLAVLRGIAAAKCPPPALVVSRTVDNADFVGSVLRLLTHADAYVATLAVELLGAVHPTILAEAVRRLQLQDRVAAYRVAHSVAQLLSPQDSDDTSQDVQAACEGRVCDPTPQALLMIDRVFNVDAEFWNAHRAVLVLKSRLLEFLCRDAVHSAPSLMTFLLCDGCADASGTRPTSMDAAPSSMLLTALINTVGDAATAVRHPLLAAKMAKLLFLLQRYHSNGDSLAALLLRARGLARLDGSDILQELSIAGDVAAVERDPRVTYRCAFLMQILAAELVQQDGCMPKSTAAVGSSSYGKGSAVGEPRRGRATAASSTLTAQIAQSHVRMLLEPPSAAAGAPDELTQRYLDLTMRDEDADMDCLHGARNCTAGTASNLVPCALVSWLINVIHATPKLAHVRTPLEVLRAGAVAAAVEAAYHVADPSSGGAASIGAASSFTESDLAPLGMGDVLAQLALPDLFAPGSSEDMDVPRLDIPALVEAARVHPDAATLTEAQWDALLRPLARANATIASHAYAACFVQAWADVAEATFWSHSAAAPPALLMSVAEHVLRALLYSRRVGPAFHVRATHDLSRVVLAAVAAATASSGAAASPMDANARVLILIVRALQMAPALSAARTHLLSALLLLLQSTPAWPHDAECRHIILRLQPTLQPLLVELALDSARALGAAAAAGCATEGARAAAVALRLLSDLCRCDEFARRFAVSAVSADLAAVGGPSEALIAFVGAICSAGGPLDLVISAALSPTATAASANTAAELFECATAVVMRLASAGCALQLRGARILEALPFMTAWAEARRCLVSAPAVVASRPQSALAPVHASVALRYTTAALAMATDVLQAGLIDHSDAPFEAAALLQRHRALFAFLLARPLHAAQEHPTALLFLRREVAAVAACTQFISVLSLCPVLHAHIPELLVKLAFGEVVADLSAILQRGLAALSGAPVMSGYLAPHEVPQALPPTLAANCDAVADFAAQLATVAGSVRQGATFWGSAAAMPLEGAGVSTEMMIGTSSGDGTTAVDTACDEAVAVANETAAAAASSSSLVSSVSTLDAIVASIRHTAVAAARHGATNLRALRMLQSAAASLAESLTATTLVANVLVAGHLRASAGQLAAPAGAIVGMGGLAAGQPLRTSMVRAALGAKQVADDVMRVMARNDGSSPVGALLPPALALDAAQTVAVVLHNIKVALGEADKIGGRRGRD